MEIPKEYWHYINFEKEIDFDDFLDFTELLSDTTISPYRSHFYSLYSKDILNIPHPDSVTESRRTPLEVLKRRDFSKKVIEKIESNSMPGEWFLVGLHSKEREIKNKSRLFAKMVLEMRIYFASTERNLANGIMKYLPTQTMTWSEAEVSKYLLKMTA